MLEVTVHAGAEHLALDPEFAGLLLRQRVGTELVADRLQKTVGVGAAEVVALATAPVIKNALAAVCSLDRHELVCDFANRHVPANRLVTPVRSTAQGRGQPVSAILVVIHALRLLADVAPRGRVRVIAADLDDMTAMLPAELHLNAAVDAAQDAGGLFPLGVWCGHGGPVPTCGLFVSRHRAELT